MYPASLLRGKFNKFVSLTAVVLAVLAAFPLANASFADEKFNIQEVPLAVERKTVRHKKAIPGFVRKIIVAREYAAFVSDRTVWIKFHKKKPVPLSKLVSLPPGFDWYETACAVGEQLLISVGNYSEQQRLQDLETGRGGYVEGPRPVGMLIASFHPAEAALISLVNVEKQPSAAAKESAVPEAIRPKFQSCFSNGKDLYLGEYGSLARLDLESMTAELLEFDAELMINRVSIWKEGGTLWYAADEGGAGGSWIEKLDVSGPAAKKISNYTLLNEGMTLPDSILRFKGRLLASSLAGVVEIDEANKMFIQYRLTNDPKTMRVYKLSVIGDQLWGLREDGWVRFDLDKKKAVHYRLEGDGSNNIQSLGYFDGEWFVGTDREVVRIR